MLGATSRSGPVLRGASVADGGVRLGVPPTLLLRSSIRDGRGTMMKASTEASVMELRAQWWAALADLQRAEHEYRVGLRDWLDGGARSGEGPGVPLTDRVTYGR